VFVTSDFEMLQAESQYRGHAIIEQAIADAAASALAHLPSGSFNANAAWAVLWSIAHNLTRAAGGLAGTYHARATTATIQAHLINVPARVAHSARRLTLHLPQHWPWERLAQPARRIPPTASTTPSLTRPPPNQNPTGQPPWKAGQTGSPLTPGSSHHQSEDQESPRNDRRNTIGGSGLRVGNIWGSGLNDRSCIFQCL
jgi:hypothetical protein